MNSNQNAIAIALEVIPGFFQVFGLGHLYAGRVGRGLAIMVAYWVLLAVNLALMGLWIGFITAPLTWLGFAIFSSTDVIGIDKRLRG